MLADAVAEALRMGGPLAATTTGWEPRPGQLAMAARVAEGIDNDERLLVEATAVLFGAGQGGHVFESEATEERPPLRG